MLEAQYWSDLSTYGQMPGAEQQIRLWKILKDDTKTHPVDPSYLVQYSWALAHLLAIKPERVVDVGANPLLLVLLAKLWPTVSFDLRPLPLEIAGLTCRKGSLLKLPLRDGLTELVMSMCVLEHIGLGRYGDELDPQGTVKALAEITRVVRPGGHLLFSVPWHRRRVLWFNAHRFFPIPYMEVLLRGDWVIEDELFYGDKVMTREELPNPASDRGVVWCLRVRREG